MGLPVAPGAGALAAVGDVGARSGPLLPLLEAAVDAASDDGDLCGAGDGCPRRLGSSRRDCGRVDDSSVLL